MKQKGEELERNLLSAHARHKEDVEKLEASLRQSHTRTTALEQEITRKEEHIKCKEQEIRALQLDENDKSKMVCDFAEHLLNLIDNNHQLVAGNLSHC